MRKIVSILFTIVLSMTTMSCEVPENNEPCYTIDEQEIIVDGLSREYRFLFVNDLHIIIPNEHINTEDQATVTNRFNEFVNSEAIPSSQYWINICSDLNKEQADEIILNGDLLDFWSEENEKCLKTGLTMLKTPHMYLLADHDMEPWFTNYDSFEKVEIKASFDADSNIKYQEFDDLLLVGLNKSTGTVTVQDVAFMKELIEKGKPIVFVTHVPFNSAIDSTLAQKSRETQNNRVLLWGKDCFYYPDQNMSALMDLILGENSPVIAVIGGHLHLGNYSMLTERIPEITFDASYKGVIGSLTIKPKEQ